MTDSPLRLQDIVRSTAATRIARLQALFLSDNPEGVATLARLRRCPPASVGSDPLVWRVTLADLPSEMLGSVDGPGPAERAVHAALVLYALHQQSGQQPVHRPGVPFGAAVGQLARARAVDEELDRSTVRRLQHAALATDFEGHLHHLRGLVQLMRAESPAIQLDYGLLTVDLWQLADPRRDSDAVLLRWGRGLHQQPENTGSTTNEETA